ncbi:MAG: hypothetical protein RLZZ28_267 [Bacteroidota bacterium]
MKKTIASAFLFCSITAYAQVQWPVITQTAKPWTRWWWEGSAVDKENLTAAMQQYRSAGLGGLEITPIYGVKGHETEFIDFLSPKWMEMLQHTLHEGKRLGLGIDMANATGWPFGGPWVKPADACKNVNTKIYLLKEGEQLNEPVRFTQQPLSRSESRMQVDLKKLSYPIATNKNLQAYAFDQVRYEMELSPSTIIAYSDKGDMLDITSKVDTGGKLNWTAPAGNWKLYALFIGFHGKMVERAAPGGEGDVIDHFNAIALKHYLNRFDSAFQGKDITSIRSFFNDSYEVDDARGQSNWTPDFLQEFQLRRGYDLRKYIPQLFGRDSSVIGRRVLVDYRQTISDLLLDNFTKPWQHWASAKSKMVRNQSHGSPANILDLYAVVDIPETEGADILRFKFATSTAHVMGKPLASSETATWLNEHFQSSLGDVKQAVDKYFVGGVNHVFWHGTNYSPQKEAWPGWLFYAAVHFTPANPFWKDFGTLNNYVARCQSFLQKGKQDNNLLLYFPFNDRIAEMGRDLLLHFDGMEGFDKTVFKSSAEWLLKQGYAFDLISDKQVLGIKNKGAFLQTGDVNYQTIVVPDVKLIPLETLRKLKYSAEAGANIIFYKTLPSDVPGLANLQERQKELTDILNGLQFSAIANSSAKKAIIGKGAFLLGSNLDELLDAAHTQREKLVDKGLQYARRSYAGGHYYFISNPEKTAVNEWVPLQVKEKNILLFDPMNQKGGVAKTRIENGMVQVLLQLEAGETCILQTMSSQLKLNPYPYYRRTENKQVLEGKWAIRFLNGGPVLPAETTSSSLGSWTDLPGEEVKNFSGTAQYSIHFKKPGFKAENYVIDLGNVQESAELILNGKKITVLLGPVYKAMIPAALFKEDNLLQVNITNGMPNRIAYLEKAGVVWKKFYNTNFPSRLPQNRGADGIFTAAKWQPKAAGLLGPVVISGLEIVQ